MALSTAKMPSKKLAGPPGDRFFSKPVTLAPPSAAVKAAASPAAPDPITTTSVSAGRLFMVYLLSIKKADLIAAPELDRRYFKSQIALQATFRFTLYYFFVRVRHYFTEAL